MSIFHRNAKVVPIQTNKWLLGGNREEGKADVLAVTLILTVGTLLCSTKLIKATATAKNNPPHSAETRGTNRFCKSIYE